MERLDFIFVLAIFYLSCTNNVHCCSKLQTLSGTIAASHKSGSTYTGCWKIEVPKDKYVTLNIAYRKFHGLGCDRVYIDIKAAVTNQTWHYCSYAASEAPVIALNDVTVSFSLVGYPSGWSYEETSFQIVYKIEDIMCTRKNHFRCSQHSCIHQEKVCNRIDDCENGKDENGCETGVATIKEVNGTRNSTVAWLKGERSASFVWGKETHRAITALYLAGENHFHGGRLEEELMAKQLELQTSVALLRNSTDPLSLSDISMFINALKVTCHNPRHFYGHDLLQILRELIDSSKSPIPGAYLTLCNANWTLSEKHLHNMLKLLREPSEYPFILDVQAMTVMALTCIKNKMNNFGSVVNATRLYNATIEKFISGQLPDGSFGNIYTTALVTQALIASGQESNKLWNLNATMQYVIHQLNSSKDFMSVYFTLPILNSKSLVDIGEIKCSSPRKKREDAEIADMRNKLGGKMRIKYSLFVGDCKDVIYTISLRAPESSSAYDIMRLAEVADHKYKFQCRRVDGHIYIYEIARITNDPEAGKFWLLYTQEDPHMNGTLHHHTKSPDKIILEDEEHLIMWYKTAHL